MKKTSAFILFLVFSLSSMGQTQLDYYLPEGTYNSNIPTPVAIIGHEIGEWHITHDKLVYYMRAVAAASPRVTLIENGKTHEDRPQLLLAITSEANQARLEELRVEHKKLTDPNVSDQVDISNLPAVVWQGFSIHGNEPSGGNASVLAAYYYAAAEGSEIEEILDNTIILLDPSFNPDGFNRFANWANSNRSKNLVADPNNREQNEYWPRSRTNHYHFDLNRDWLPVQQPESKNRIDQFHRWKPNILTDHHEMGTNSTFFFQPGIPSRNNPNTPANNTRLTERIAEYHKAAFDEIGSLYYSQESFDDFYYGKGSTFPDINGAVGILFEQASSRGHAQESVNGILKFPFTIRNQFTTILSTAKAAVALREDLLSHQRQFFKDAIADAKKNSQKGLLFGSKGDQNRARELANVMTRHEIEVYPVTNNTSANGQSFEAGTSYFVPTEQAQARLAHIMFEKVTKFQDSLFYDVSAWTLPLAFDLEFTYVDARKAASVSKGDLHVIDDRPVVSIERAEYAYLFRWDDYMAPKFLNRLFESEVRVKVATTPFQLNGASFDRGTIIVPTQIQDMDGDALFAILQNTQKDVPVNVYASSTGNSMGVNLGSPTVRSIEKPEIAIVVEGGTSQYDVGEVWHLLDNRFDISLSLVPMRIFNRIDLGRYNTIILVNGGYSDINSNKVEQLKTWVRNGGNIIAMKSANNWLNSQEFIKLDFSRSKTPKDGRDDYSNLSNVRGAQVTGGTIFETNIDITNPLGYGYRDRSLPIFVNSNTFFEVTENPYAYPVQFTSDPLMSGYVSEENYERIKDKAAVIVSQMGAGKIVSMSFNPNFRAFWYGTNRLFLNAIYFGDLIDRRATK
ncbi:MAG: M14 family zinc carboxypeptidase [Cytophagales bacterium]|nr:M14 family zinc carboxypeptidase [Cytophagales bacterium]